MMKNHFGIDVEDESISEYFESFVVGTKFNYSGFISHVITLHVPDEVNEKKIPYYSLLHEVCNILLNTSH
jgi:hypothetical protein